MAKTCQFANCTEPHYARGHCRRHYRRLHQYGDPTPQKPQSYRGHGKSLKERLWMNVDQSAGPAACWPWTASTHRFGYGQLWDRTQQPARLLPAHRLAWQLTHGPIPAGLSVLHHCDNPRCCNTTIPAGLLATHMKALMTRASAESFKALDSAELEVRKIVDSFDDSIHLYLGTQSDNVRDAHRRKRNYQGPLARFTADEVREIRRMAAQGWTQPQIAERFGGHRGHIGRIIRRESWKHLD